MISSLQAAPSCAVVNVGSWAVLERAVVTCSAWTGGRHLKNIEQHATQHAAAMPLLAEICLIRQMATLKAPSVKTALIRAIAYGSHCSDAHTRRPTWSVSFAESSASLSIFPRGMPAPDGSPVRSAAHYWFSVKLGGHVTAKGNVTPDKHMRDGGHMMCALDRFGPFYGQVTDAVEARNKDVRAYSSRKQGLGVHHARSRLLPPRH